jgi:hypothetical protein
MNVCCRRRRRRRRRRPPQQFLDAFDACEELRGKLGGGLTVIVTTGIRFCGDALYSRGVPHVKS